MRQIIKTIWIKAAPETVWQHLVERDKLAAWFQLPASDLSEGEDFRMTQAGQGPDGDVWGRVLEMRPPERMVWAFDHNHLNHETTVIFTLVAKDGGTEFTLTHTGFEGAPGDIDKHVSGHDDGWTPHLTALKAGAEI